MSSGGKDKYALSDSQREVERLQKQHAWMRTCLDGKVFFAPIDITRSDLKILDMGCADGTLLRDMRKIVPDTAELVGTDLTSAFLPESPDGNIRYAIGDVCAPPAEDLAGRFDLTNVRLVLPFCGKVGPVQAIANMAATLAPGGWLQEAEIDPTCMEEDRPAFNHTNELMCNIMQKSGLGDGVPLRMEEGFKKAGLDNVTIQKVKLPAGRLLGKEEDVQNSLIPFKLSIPSLIKIGTSMGVDYPASMTENLPERFEQEMLEKGAAYTMIVATGQRKA